VTNRLYFSDNPRRLHVNFFPAAMTFEMLDKYAASLHTQNMRIEMPLYIYDVHVSYANRAFL